MKSPQRRGRSFSQDYLSFPLKLVFGSAARLADEVVP